MWFSHTSWNKSKKEQKKDYGLYPAGLFASLRGFWDVVTTDLELATLPKEAWFGKQTIKKIHLNSMHGNLFKKIIKDHFFSLIKKML